MQFDDDKVDLSELDDRRGHSGGSGGGMFGGASTGSSSGPSAADALGGLGALLGSKSLGGMGGIGSSPAPKALVQGTALDEQKHHRKGRSRCGNTRIDQNHDPWEEAVKGNN